jgi:hypothetical protein
MLIARSAAAALTLLSLASPSFAATPPGFKGQPFERSRAYWRSGGQVRPAWFVCAPVDGADMTVVTPPDAKGRITVAQPLSGEAPSVYRLGQADPGAGQIYWSLSDERGREVGQIHAVNPGMIDDPKAATIPTVTWIRIAGAQWDCRWLGRTRLMGFTRRRAVMVTEAPGGTLEYRTFDVRDAARLKRIQAGGIEQTTTASLDLKGGKATASGFEFRNGAYAYDVAASPAGAQITVRKGGKVVTTEPLIAWTIGAKP